MDSNVLLKSKGLKVTKARVAILNILSDSDHSLTVEMIFEKLKDLAIDINLSTVYRCVEQFEEKEIVDKFVLKEGIFSYRLKGEEHKHLLECSICHKEIQVPCPMKQIEELVQSETGFTLMEHNLIMKGVCKDCKKK